MSRTTFTPGPWAAMRDENGLIEQIIAPCHEHKPCHKTIVFRVTHNIPDWMSRSKEEHIEACCCEGNFALWQAAPMMRDLLEVLSGGGTVVPFAEAIAAWAAKYGLPLTEGVSLATLRSWAIDTAIRKAGGQ